MAYGIPVIASDVGGIRDIVNDDTGILVNPKSYSSIVEAVNDLSYKPALRKHYVSNAYGHIERNFTLSVITNQFKEMYEDNARN